MINQVGSLTGDSFYFKSLQEQLTHADERLIMAASFAEQARWGHICDHLEAELDQELGSLI